MHSGTKELKMECVVKIKIDKQNCWCFFSTKLTLQLTQTVESACASLYTLCNPSGREGYFDLSSRRCGILAHCFYKTAL